ncbi:MAG: DUF4384 domain-containing protein [Sterolibacteriaceae bacterium]|nr:DUF4384 domain-containing protein [Sterolibacteriaceae bacterium]
MGNESTECRGRTCTDRRCRRGFHAGRLRGRGQGRDHEGRRRSSRRPRSAAVSHHHQFLPCAALHGQLHDHLRRARPVGTGRGSHRSDQEGQRRYARHADFGGLRHDQAQPGRAAGGLRPGLEQRDRLSPASGKQVSLLADPAVRHQGLDLPVRRECGEKGDLIRRLARRNPELRPGQYRCGQRNRRRPHGARHRGPVGSARCDLAQWCAHIQAGQGRRRRCPVPQVRHQLQCVTGQVGRKRPGAAKPDRTLGRRTVRQADQHAILELPRRRPDERGSQDRDLRLVLHDVARRRIHDRLLPVSVFAARHLQRPGRRQEQPETGRGHRTVSRHGRSAGQCQDRSGAVLQLPERGTCQAQATFAATKAAAKPVAEAPTEPIKLAINATAKSGAKFGRGESIGLIVQPDRDAFVYCYLRDEKNKLQRFFPNRFSRNAMVSAKDPLLLPGNMRFEIAASAKGVAETVMCFATPDEALNALPEQFKAPDFEPLANASFDQIRTAFATVAGKEMGEAQFKIDVQ